MKYAKIVVPFGFSVEDRLALRKALDVQRETSAKLILVHIIDYVPPSYIKPELPEIFASEPLMIERASQHLKEVIEEENAIDCDSIVKAGNVKIELPIFINQNNVDLVVMTRHNQTGIEKLIGSTTDAVVRNTKCDVLVAHQN